MSTEENKPIHRYTTTIDLTRHDLKLSKSAETVGILFGSPFKLGTLVNLEYQGDAFEAGKFAVLGRVVKLKKGLPDPRYSAVKWIRVISREGVASLKEYLKLIHGYDPDSLAIERFRALGSVWYFMVAPDDPEAELKPAQELSTKDIKELFDSVGERKILNIYLTCPATYTVSQISYRGKAIKLNDQWLTVHTNNPLPTLGVRSWVELNLDGPDGIEHVLVQGTVQRRVTEGAQSAFKAEFAVRVIKAAEIERPGILKDFLKRSLEEKE